VLGRGSGDPASTAASGGCGLLLSGAEVGPPAWGGGGPCFAPDRGNRTDQLYEIK
jgi:hypothetical protein